MALSKQFIIDSTKNIMTHLLISDERAYDDNLISFFADQIRAQIIIADYNKNGIVRQEWLSDLSFVDFHKVNIADDINVTYCECDISKATVPKVVSFTGEGGNPDIGFPVIMSVCGKWKYYPYSIGLWKDVPKEHPRALFKYYSRIDTTMYVNQSVEKLRLLAVLESPEDGYIIQSEPVTSGNLVAGTTYVVKYKQITYNSVVIAVNGTFIAQTGLPTYTGTGTVYLASQLKALTRTQPYPVSMDMARQIVIEICTKEFGIARSAIPDVLNDNVDDEVTAKSVSQ